MTNGSALDSERVEEMGADEVDRDAESHVHPTRGPSWLSSSRRQASGIAGGMAGDFRIAITHARAARVSIAGREGKGLATLASTAKALSPRGWASSPSPATVDEAVVESLAASRGREPS